MNLISQVFEKAKGRMVENRMHRIEPERIDVAINDPVERVLNKITAHLVAPRTIEIDRLSPRRLISIGEIRAKLWEIISFRPEVVVNHVQNHREAASVAGVDEHFQICRAAVGILRGKWINTVVTPVSRAGELRDRHKLDRGDAELGEIIEIGGERGERSRRGETADVKLVDDVIFKRDAAPVLIGPGKFGIHDCRRAMHSLRLQTRSRIASLIAVFELKKIKIAGLRVLNDRFM